MPETSNQSKDNAAISGGQATPSTGEGVNEWERLRQNFTYLTNEQRIATLSDALKYGEEGIDLLIKILNNDKELTVRATAYRLLQGLQFRKAQQAIAKGLLLNPGDRIYSVYKSDIGYGDDFYYLINQVTSSVEKYYLYYAGRHFYDNILDPSFEFNYNEFGEVTIEGPQAISHHVYKSKAEKNAKLLHQQIIFDERTPHISSFDWKITDFGINRWCELNNIPLNYPGDETCSYMNDFLEDLSLKPDYKEILAKLVEDLVGKFAFVHEVIIQEVAYLDIVEDVDC